MIFREGRREQMIIPLIRLLSHNILDVFNIIQIESSNSTGIFISSCARNLKTSLTAVTFVLTQLDMSKTAVFIFHLYNTIHTIIIIDEFNAETAATQE